EVLPVFVPLNIVVSSWLAVRGRAFVDRRLLLARILPRMGLGLAVGLFIFESASHELLRRVFGAFVVVLAALELRRLARTGQENPAVTPRAATPALVGAGVIHGMFSTGGPLLVWALGRSLTEKRAFRATLACVFVVVASTLTLSYAVNDRLDTHTLRATAALLPVLGIALAVGEWAHHRIDEHRFRALVYVLLLGAGLSSLL
ncbi:MAG: sulfite exporter TauE/SafE family protein, partial [Myxococcota bacterium]